MKKVRRCYFFSILALVLVTHSEVGSQVTPESFALEWYEQNVSSSAQSTNLEELFSLSYGPQESESEGSDHFGFAALIHCEFIRGDTNYDQVVNIADAAEILAVTSNSAAIESIHPDAADVNDDGAVNIADGIALLAFLFSGGLPPSAPFPLPDQDPTADWLNPACDGIAIPYQLSLEALLSSQGSQEHVLMDIQNLSPLDLVMRIDTTSPLQVYLWDNTQIAFSPASVSLGAAEALISWPLENGGELDPHFLAIRTTLMAELFSSSAALTGIPIDSFAVPGIPIDWAANGRELLKRV